MASIFDLKTSVEELSSANQGTSRMEYDQHPPTRDVTTTNFPNGAIHFRWQTSGQKWWVPSRSYLRVRCKLGRADGVQLTLDDNIAPNMGLCASLFQSAEFRINDKTISRISDFMPQVDAIETRLSKSKAHLEGIGAASNLWDVDFAKRQSVVIADGVYNPIVVSSRTSRTQLGFDAATNTIAIAADTGVLTFAANGGQALPNPLPFSSGDEIEIVVGGVWELCDMSSLMLLMLLQFNSITFKLLQLVALRLLLLVSVVFLLMKHVELKILNLLGRLPFLSLKWGTHFQAGNMNWC
jgi:hypothetical protein